MIFQVTTKHRFVAAFMAYLMTITPPLAQADNSAVINSAKSEAQWMQNNFEMPTQSGGNINYKDFDGNQSSYQTSDLTPYTSGSINADDEFPDGVETDLQTFKDSFDDAGGMANKGRTNATKLYEDATKPEPTTIQGSAYSVVLDATNRQRPDFTNDPLFGPGSVTGDYLENPESVVQGISGLDEFEDCEDTGTLNPVTKTRTISELKTCNEVPEVNGSCTVDHNYRVVPVVTHYSGEYALDNCGEGCADLMIGQVGDNYWAGSCDLKTKETIVKVENPAAIQSAVLERVKWDDHIRIWVGEPGSETLVWWGPHHGKWPKAPYSNIGCELDTSWDENPNLDITALFKSAAPGELLRFKIEVVVAGNGEGFGRIRLRYDRNKVIEDKWGELDSVVRLFPPVRAASNSDLDTVLSFDMTTGTGQFVSPTQGTIHKMAVPKVNLDEYCGTDPATAYTQVDLAYASHWGSSAVGYAQDTTAELAVMEAPTCDNGLKGKVHIWDTHRGSGNKSYTLGGEFTFKLTRYTIPYDDCLNKLNSIRDGLTQGTITCVQQPVTDCITENAEEICVDDLKPPPLGGAGEHPAIPDISPMCRKLEIDITRNPYEAPPAEGSQGMDNCDQYYNDPKCGFLSQECQEGAEGEATGQCQMYSTTFECSEVITYEGYESETNLSCGGPMACLGEECTVLANDQSASFEEAASTLNAMQMIQNDIECENPQIGDTCEIFKGKGLECKRAVEIGGWAAQDCCDLPVQTDMGTYLEGMFMMNRLDSGLASLYNNPSSPLHQSAGLEGYNNARNAVIDGASAGWDAITEPFTSSASSVMDSIQPATEAVTQAGEWVTAQYDAAVQAVDSFRQEIAQKSAELFGEVSSSLTGGAGAGAGAADQAVDAAAEEGAQSLTEAALGQTGAAYLSAFMTAYSAVMMAYLAVQIVFECEEPEFELATKKDLKSCYDIGSYCNTKIPISPFGPMVCVEYRYASCCFNSPLSRIIQQQVSAQLGMPRGNAKNPICEGIPISKMKDIDWSQIDLSEWFNIQAANGTFPQIDEMNMDNLTGDGSAFNLGGSGRRTTEERFGDALDGVEDDTVRRESANRLNVFTGENAP